MWTDYEIKLIASYPVTRFWKTWNSVHQILTQGSDFLPSVEAADQFLSLWEHGAQCAAAGHNISLENRHTRIWCFFYSTHMIRAEAATEAEFHGFTKCSLISLSLLVHPSVSLAKQVITPCRRLILCADNRKEMEEWMAALRSIQNRQNYEVWLFSLALIFPVRAADCVCVCSSPPSTAWTTSVGCTTGTPALTPDRRTATSAERLCQGWRHTACLVKVHSVHTTYRYTQYTMYTQYIDNVFTMTPQAYRLPVTMNLWSFSQYFYNMIPMWRLCTVVPRYNRTECPPLMRDHCIGTQIQKCWALYVHMYATYEQLMPSVYLTYKQHISNLYTTYIQHTDSVYTTFTKPYPCVLQCVNLKPISAVRFEPPTTASGPHLLLSGRTSLRTRMGWEVFLWSSNVSKCIHLNLWALTSDLPPVLRCQCLTSGWRETCQSQLNVTFVIRRVAASCVCRTGGVCGVKPWWDRDVLMC